jgi:predicted anti-sigma-YlaC factor YlaD
MDHEEARSFFSDYYDKELSDSVKKKVETHLAECDSCKKEWEAFKKAVDEVSGWQQFV